MDGAQRGGLGGVEEIRRHRRRAAQGRRNAGDGAEVEADGHGGGEAQLVPTGQEGTPEGEPFPAQWRMLAAGAFGTASGAVDAVVSAVAEVPFGGGAKAFFSATASSAG